MKVKARFVITLVMFVLSLITRGAAQICPPDDGSLNPGKPTSLIGTIRTHPGLRPWISLEVSPKVCGQSEFQLTFIQDDSSSRYQQTEALPDCKVEIKGSIEASPTAHYSADMYIQDAEIVPGASCHPKPISADPSKIPIPSDLQSYRASVSIDFGNLSKPLRGTANRNDSTTEILTPWRNYMSTWLNGSEDLIWVMCHDGFQLTTAIAKVNCKTVEPDLSQKDQAGLSAGEKPGPSSITITCIRSSNQPAPASSNK